MKNTLTNAILLLIVLSFSHLGNAQLLDPFGKVKTHEIKLKKLKDGTRAGAMEWTTGGIDSLQRFFIKGLDVKAPVMVSIISKAPDHNIDLSFHKKGWNTMESKISTDGEKFATKTFRTMNSAGLGVTSKVAGIPYLITVKVGLQFPSTNSLIRVTDNKAEYEQHMQKLGFNSDLFGDDNEASTSGSNGGGKNADSSGSALTYLIIGLLSIIIILLVVFIFKKKSTNKVTLTILIFCSAQFCFAQTNAPKEVPINGQGDSPVFYEYQTSNIPNQNTVPVTTDMNSEDVYIGDNPGDVFLTRPVRVETNAGSVPLDGEEADEIERRMQEDRDNFNRDYGEGSPGEDTEGTQRTLPSDITQEELDQLRREVRRLQRQVDLLSRDDEQYEEGDGEGGAILVYCEQIEACRNCIQKGLNQFATTQGYLQYLQDFYSSEINSITAQIAQGNAIANSVPGAGTGWAQILRHNVMPAVNDLRRAYSKKFDEYINAMYNDLEVIKKCYTGDRDRFPSTGAYEAQVQALILSLKTTKINT